MVSAHLKRELKKLYHPFFIINYILISLFFISKTFSPICNHLFSSCHIDFNEYQILIFLCSMVTLRSKRYSTIVNYVSHFCMFGKFANLFMFFQQNILYALCYGILWIFQVSFVSQPVYRGEDRVIYFNDTSLTDELKKDSRTVWLIAFYNAWSPACINLAPIFAELSQYYGNNFLKFGKIDVSKNNESAIKYKIDTTNWSTNLPTVILFRNGKEVTRRPGISMAGKVIQKYNFNWENIVQSFELNELLIESNSFTKKSDVAIDNEQKKKD